mmetsp:Transcript_36226/g.80603  ORF Transcript_36226/g.80603 Transcript_36226/m.80603 type:complete len:240 (+) Transcript_36226:633-1352(+)
MPRVNKPSKSRVPPGLEDLSHPLLGTEPTLKLMLDPNEVRGFSSQPSSSQRGGGPPREPNFVLKLLGLTPSSKKLARATPMRIEPKTFFANERTFLAWLHMAVTIASISAALLGFASGDAPDAESVSKHLVELIALILLPVGMCMVGYALWVFWWRASSIAQKKAVQMDDRVGPLALCAMVIVSLSCIFFICCLDFYEVMQEQGQSPPPPPSGLPGTPFPPPSIPLPPGAPGTPLTQAF